MLPSCSDYLTTAFYFKKRKEKTEAVTQMMTGAAMVAIRAGAYV
jgi:hypothetical protein